MASKLELVNRALGFLGEPTITSTTSPETAAGRKIVNIYDDVRREVLRSHPWNFAECWKEVDITTTPPFGYDDAYQLPEDFLTLLVIGDMVQDERDYRLLYQGDPDFRRVIALNNSGADTLQIAYTADVTLLTIWDPLVLKVFALQLAADSAKAITGEDEMVASLNQQLTEAVRDAVGVDGNEQSIRLHLMSGVQRARDTAQYGDSFFTNVQFP